jgi:hypothetical protein
MQAAAPRVGRVSCAFGFPRVCRSVPWRPVAPHGGPPEADEARAGGAWQLPGATHAAFAWRVVTTATGRGAKGPPGVRPRRETLRNQSPIRYIMSTNGANEYLPRLPQRPRSAGPSCGQYTLLLALEAVGTGLRRTAHLQSGATSLRRAVKNQGGPRGFENQAQALSVLSCLMICSRARMRSDLSTSDWRKVRARAKVLSGALKRKT